MNGRGEKGKELNEQAFVYGERKEEKTRNIK